MLHAIVYVAEQGGHMARAAQLVRQRAYPLTRMTRWAKSGVLDRVVAPVPHTQTIRVKIEAMALDRTLVKVHSDGTGR